MDTDIGIDGELLVRNHEAVEVGTDDVAERPRRKTQRQLTVTTLTADNDLNKILQFSLRQLLLLTFAFRGISVHKRQADVTLRHRQRLAALQTNALGTQFPVKHLYSQPRAITAGTEGIRVMRGQRREVRGKKGEATDELSDDAWRLPSVYGKAKTNALVLLKGVLTRSMKFIGYEKQPVVSGR